MAEPRHEFLDGCTSDRSGGTASVPKVVEVNARNPGIGARLDPDRPEVLAPELAALRADEHQAAGTGFGVAVEVNSEIRHDLRRERDNPPASRRLRRIGTKPALVELCRRLDDADLTRVRVETVTAQARQLTEPKRREGGQEHQGPEPSGNLRGEVEDDRQRDHRAFFGFLYSCLVDPARVATDQPVIRRSCQDGVKQPVRLGHCHRPERTLSERTSIKPRLASATDGSLVDPIKRDRAEGRQQVIAEQARVKLPGPGLEHPIGQPLVRAYTPGRGRGEPIEDLGFVPADEKYGLDRETAMTIEATRAPDPKTAEGPLNGIWLSRYEYVSSGAARRRTRMSITSC